MKIYNFLDLKSFEIKFEFYKISKISQKFQRNSTKSEEKPISI